MDDRKLSRLSVFADAGGTSLRLWAERGGRRQKQARFPSDPTQIKNRLEKFCRALHLKPACLTVGLRGVWTRAEKKRWARALAPLAARVVVLSDIEFAHERIFHGGPGIVLNAGTGSIAFGRGKTGRAARAGGLGPLVGDEGSAFWIGREYLRRVVKDDGEIRAIAVGKNPVRAIAAFSRKALTEQGEKHRVAAAIISEAQNHLKDLALGLAQTIGAHASPIALVGGLFENEAFRKTFMSRLWKTGTGVRFK